MANRYDRRYDEHRPPQEGIEKEIMKILEAGPLSPRALVNALVGKGYDDTSVSKNTRSKNTRVQPVYFLLQS